MSTPIVSKLRGLLRVEEAPKDDNADGQRHLYGLRGLLAISSILWVFFETFIPALVDNETEGPTYQKALRIIFSPLLWNESLIAGFFFALSSRSICVRFLKDPKPTNFAGSLIRRVIRMAFGVGIASGIASGIFKALGPDYIDVFRSQLPNNSISTVQIAETPLMVWNSIFELFWVVRGWSSQAGNNFWPTQTMWNLSLIFQQSWTVYIAMVILPFTRPGWHKEGLFVFALGSFWMCSWGWYNAAGLLLADYAVNPKLRHRLEEGLTIKEDWKIPFAAPGFVMILVGAIMKYLWTVWPKYADKELYLHPYLDLAENTTRASFAAADPFPRVDNFLVIFGLLILVETTPQIKSLLSRGGLVWIGKRSLSLFIAQSLVFWTAGIKLYMHLHVTQGVGSPVSKLCVFVTCTFATFLFGEVYYRALDLPSQWLAKSGYNWLMH